jgi:acid stress chaperone HdeA
MKRIMATAIGVATLVLSGCSASQVINTGGDTKCSDFIKQDENKQNTEVSKMLKDRSGAEPNNLDISTTRMATATWCQTLAPPDSKISAMPHL